LHSTSQHQLAVDFIVVEFQYGWSKHKLDGWPKHEFYGWSKHKLDSRAEYELK